MPYNPLRDICAVPSLYNFVVITASICPDLK